MEGRLARCLDIFDRTDYVVAIPVLERRHGLEMILVEPSESLVSDRGLSPHDSRNDCIRAIIAQSPSPGWRQVAAEALIPALQGLGYVIGENEGRSRCVGPVNDLDATVRKGCVGVDCPDFQVIPEADVAFINPGQNRTIHAENLRVLEAEDIVDPLGVLKGHRNRDQREVAFLEILGEVGVDRLRW